MCIGSSGGLTLSTPATPVDLADVFGEGSYVDWRVALAQLGAGPSHAIRSPDGRALVVGGYVPDAGWLATWFWASPAAASHMGAVLRLVRLTLAEHGQDRIYAEVRSEPGRRIARLLGYRFASKWGQHEVWTHG